MHFRCWFSKRTNIPLMLILTVTEMNGLNKNSMITSLQSRKLELYQTDWKAYYLEMKKRSQGSIRIISLTITILNLIIGIRILSRIFEVLTNNTRCS